HPGSIRVAPAAPRTSRCPAAASRSAVAWPWRPWAPAAAQQARPLSFLLEIGEWCLVIGELSVGFLKRNPEITQWVSVGFLNWNYLVSSAGVRLSFRLPARR